MASYFSRHYKCLPAIRERALANRLRCVRLGLVGERQAKERASERAAERSGERKDRKERTRERLLAAALELLRNEGVGAVTVSQVTKKIEVHHSLFYAHFADIDACLAAAADHVLTQLAPVDRELRRELMGRAVTNRRELAQYFEGAFERWLAERACVELLLSHRLDRSPIGEALRPALAAMRDEMTTELWDLAAQVGLAGKHFPEVRALADLHMGNWLWALETLIEGRMHDRKALAAMLADLVVSSNLRFFDRARRPSRDELVSAAFREGERAQLNTAREHLRALIAAHDDAYLVARAGSEEILIDRVLEGTCKYFLRPHRGADAVRTRYRVTTPSTIILRDLVASEAGCAMERPIEGDATRPTLVFTMSLRTLLETISGTRHFDHAFRAGELQVEGDLLLALAFLDSFDYP